MRETSKGEAEAHCISEPSLSQRTTLWSMASTPRVPDKPRETQRVTGQNFKRNKSKRNQDGSLTIQCRTLGKSSENKLTGDCRESPSFRNTHPNTNLFTPAGSPSVLFSCEKTSCWGLLTCTSLQLPPPNCN